MSQPRPFSTLQIGLGSGVINALINAPLGLLLVKRGAVLPLWGLPGVAADFYVGVLRPDGSLQFVTPIGLVVGNVSDLRSFRPLATNVPLTAPFTVSQSSVLTHQWTADDLQGSYLFFVLAVRAGALAGGTVDGDQILALVSAPYAFR